MGKPKQVRRRKYECCDCGNHFYELPQAFEDDEPLCDDCREQREQDEDDDDILLLIKQQIAFYNQQQKRTK